MKERQNKNGIYYIWEYRQKSEPYRIRRNNSGLKNYIKPFDPESQNTKEQIIEGLQTAYNLGVNYFDTAASYGDARRSLERSLKNLRRINIDLIQIHGSFYSDETCDSILAKGGMADALEQARSEGLVKYIGFTIECQNPALYRFIESGRFDSMQVEYNLLFQHPYDPSWKCGSLYEAEKHKMGIVSMRTVTSGTFQKWVKTVNRFNL